jgi:hypothetical protein
LALSLTSVSYCFFHFPQPNKVCSLDYTPLSWAVRASPTIPTVSLECVKLLIQVSILSSCGTFIKCTLCQLHFLRAYIFLYFVAEISSINSNDQIVVHLHRQALMWILLTPVALLAWCWQCSLAYLTHWRVY